MRQFSSLITIVVASTMVVHCAETGMVGSGTSPQSAPVTKTSTDTADGLPTADPATSSGDSSSNSSAVAPAVVTPEPPAIELGLGAEEQGVMFNPMSSDSTPEVKYKRPLAIYFAIDVTGSMQPVISTIYNSVKSLSTKLSSTYTDIKFGGVAFEDSITSTRSLTDVNTFSTWVSGTYLGGGNDSEEASLLGVSESLTRIQAEDTRPGSLKVIIAVTDNKGHIGGGTYNNRNCSTANLISKFNSIAAADQSLFKLFYSAPSSGSYYSIFGSASCNAFATPDAQFKNILAGSLTSESVLANRGGSIGWPLSSTAVIDLSSAIEATTPSVELTCVAKSAKLFKAGQEMKSWTASSLAEVAAAAKADGQVAIFKSRVASDIDLFRSDSTLSVTSCCVLKSEADVGNFGTCVKEQTATTAFEIQ